MLVALALLVSIHTDFEAGSLGKVEKLDAAHFRCALKGETDQDHRNRQVSWYYFRLDGAAGRDITIDFTDLVGEYNYKPGAQSIKKNTPGVYSYDNQTWTHFDASQWQEGPASTLRLRFRPTRSPVWIAHVPPYTTAHLTRLLANLKREVIGKTVGGRDMLLLTVTNPAIPESRKKVVWLMFRQHSWETGSSWVGEGALRYLLSAEATPLRDEFIFKIFPMADPDGVARGGVRFNANGYDLNRNWDAVDPKTMPEIAAQRKAVLDWVDSGHRIDLFYSLHNDEEPEYIESTAGPLAERFFEALVADTSFNPSQKPRTPGVSTTPGKPGRMNVCQGLFQDRAIPCVLMEQRVAYNNKLGHYPNIDDRLKFGKELVQALSKAVQPEQTAWTHFARIGGYELEAGNAARLVRAAANALVFGIEVDNDPTGRYESFVNPQAELDAMRSAAREAHQAGHKLFAYTAGWECITSRAAKKEHSLAKDHPDWLQRRLTGEPAVFGEGAAFWVAKGDEDAWISPYAAQWRKLYMERIRQMAATGVDGVYVDIPYWMTHFDGWEETWASFDEHTVRAFRERTGLDARRDFKLGDFENPNFRRWVDFRMDTITQFMREVDRTVKSVNPDCVTIAEIFPGIEESAVSVGADVYELYQAVDVIAHEYEPDNNLATKKGPWSWFNYLTGICSFRAFAGGKATWMLGYSWDNHKKVKPPEPMKNLALAQVMAGANFWDARGHEMSGSNDDATRLEIFRWIRDNQARLYSPRQALRPVGIYFSPNTRNYFADEYMQSYKGALLAAMHRHREFQIVTPRDLADFKGDLLVVADARCLSDAEIAQMRRIFESSRSLVATGETGRYDETGAARPASPIIRMFDKPPAQGRSLYFPRCPLRAYSKIVKKEFDQGGAGVPKALDDFWRQIDGAARGTPAVEVSASPYVFAQIAEVNGEPHVFLANFKGLEKDAVMVQKPELNLRIDFRSVREGRIYFTPYLGQTRELAVKKEAGRLTAIIPELGKGGIVWVEPGDRKPATALP